MSLLTILSLIFLLVGGLVTLRLYWILKRYISLKAAKLTARILPLLLITTVIAFYIHDYRLTHHTTDFELAGEFKMTLVTHELESFLGAPNEFTAYVEDLKAGTLKQFKFGTEGADYELLWSAERQIWFRGSGRSSGWDYVLDLKRGITIDRSPEDTVSFQVITELGYEYQLLPK